MVHSGVHLVETSPKGLIVTRIQLSNPAGVMILSWYVVAPVGDTSFRSIGVFSGVFF